MTHDIIFLENQVQCEKSEISPMARVSLADSDGGAYCCFPWIYICFSFVYYLCEQKVIDQRLEGEIESEIRSFIQDGFLFQNVSPDLLFVFLKPMCRHFLFKFAYKRLILPFVFQKLCDIVWPIGAFQNLTEKIPN